MVKRLVDIDDELLAQAKEVLGMQTMKDTVNAALEEAVKLALRRQLVEQLATMDGLDLDNEEIMKGAWR